MEEKKLEIINNVGKLYLRFGIKSITMDDVATECGVSKKTLYQYFSDKKELVSEVIDFYLQKPELNLDEFNAKNAIDSMFLVRQHVNSIFKFYNNNIEYDLKKLYPKLHKKVHEAKRQRIFSNTVNNINEGKKQGYYREDLCAEIIGKLQVGRMLLTLHPDNQVFEQHEISSMSVFDHIMDYHMHAICTPKGLEYYKKQLNKIQNEENS